MVLSTVAVGSIAPNNLGLFGSQNGSAETPKALVRNPAIAILKLIDLQEREVGRKEDQRAAHRHVSLLFEVSLAPFSHVDLVVCDYTSNTDKNNALIALNSLESAGCQRKKYLDILGPWLGELSNI